MKPHRQNLKQKSVRSDKEQAESSVIQETPLCILELRQHAAVIMALLE